MFKLLHLKRLIKTEQYIGFVGICELSQQCFVLFFSCSNFPLSKNSFEINRSDILMTEMFPFQAFQHDEGKLPCIWESYDQMLYLRSHQSTRLQI